MAVLLSYGLQRRRYTSEVGHEAARNCDAVFRNADRVDKRLPHNPITTIDKRSEIHRSYGLLRPSSSPAMSIYVTMASLIMNCRMRITFSYRVLSADESQSIAPQEIF
jgi:hypothetical protein